ncbi:MAG: TonB-dependent receptor [Pseudomonadota bacterium]|nr:TonB-dependent receptor [Pseudomonadota bacterium]
MDRFRIGCLATTALATTALAGYAAPAVAQVAGPAAAATLDEVIVTAQKREQRLLDVPQSVSVVSAEMLQTVQAQRFADYFTRVPSASFVETQAGQTRLVLRGISTNGVGATVATYVDETPYGSATSLANGAILTPDIDPFDLERIEILRGPQGTLYGANSLGGLVKYVTVAPDPDGFHSAFEAGVEHVEAGDTGWSARGAVNIPLADDLAMRISGVHRQEPGYIDDPRRGDGVNDGVTEGGRVSVLYRPTDLLSVRGSAVRQTIESHAANTVDSDSVTLRPTYGDLQQSRLVAEDNAVDYTIYNVTADYDFGSTALVASASHGALDQAQVQDISGLYGPLLSDAFGLPLGATLDQNVRQRRDTLEVRLASDDGGLFDWTVGAFHTRERNRINQEIAAVDDPTGAPVDGFGGLALAEVASRYRETAGFANAVIRFSPRFELDLGGRYSRNTQTATQSTSGPLAGDSLFDGESEDEVFTYSVAPSFKPNAATTFYARVARGYRPGGPNVLPPAAPATVPRLFDPDTTTNYELGVKAEFDERRLTLDVTAFHTDWDDIQLFTAIDGFGVNANGGSARSRGVEVSVVGRPTDDLTLSANGAWIDAELTDDAPAIVGGLSGDRLPYSPRLSSTVAVDYERPLRDGMDLDAGLSWRYTGERKSAFDAAVGQHDLDAYSQIDAYAGLDFGAWRVSLYGRNLTDSRGVTDVGAAGSARDGAIAVAVTRPRSFGVTLGVRY